MIRYKPLKGSEIMFEIKIKDKLNEKDEKTTVTYKIYGPGEITARTSFRIYKNKKK